MRGFIVFFDFLRHPIDQDVVLPELQALNLADGLAKMTRQ